MNDGSMAALIAAIHGLVGGILAAYVTLRVRMTRLETTVEGMRRDLDRLQGRLSG